MKVWPDPQSDKYKRFLAPSTNKVDGEVVFPAVKYVKSTMAMSISPEAPTAKKDVYYDAAQKFVDDANKEAKAEGIVGLSNLR